MSLPRYAFVLMLAVVAAFATDSHHYAGAVCFGLLTIIETLDGIGRRS
jgi:hypothetical protein